jgi:hypothetical protein
MVPKRQPAHLGGADGRKLFGNFSTQGKLVELGEGGMAKTIVPLHQFHGVVGRGWGVFFSFFQRGRGIKHESGAAEGAGRR